MRLNEYQQAAAKYAAYVDPTYPFMALAEEAGEVDGLCAKAMRGDDIEAHYGSSEGLRDAFKKELGDVLWQLAACARELNFSLESIAQANLDKLEDRQKRGVIKGTGSDR